MFAVTWFYACGASRASKEKVHLRLERPDTATEDRERLTMADREPGTARRSHQSTRGSDLSHAPGWLDCAASRGRLAVRLQ